MFKRIIVSLVFIIALVLLAAFVWLGFFFDPNDYKTILTQRLNQNKHIKVTIEGPLQWDIWRMQLYGNDVLIQDRSGKFNSRWRQVRLHADLEDLLQNRPIPLKKVRFYQGELHFCCFKMLKSPYLTLLKTDDGLFHLNTRINTPTFSLVLSSEIRTLGQTFDFNHTEVDGKSNKIGFSLSIPKFTLKPKIQHLQFKDIAVSLNHMPGTANVEIASFQPLTMRTSYHADSIQLEHLVNLHGYRLKLDRT